MFEKEAEEWAMNLWCKGEYLNESPKSGYQKGAEFGYNRAKEEAKEIINELLMNGYDESTRAKALDFLYPDKE